MSSRGPSSTGPAVRSEKETTKQPVAVTAFPPSAQRSRPPELLFTLPCTVCRRQFPCVGPAASPPALNGDDVALLSRSSLPLPGKYLASGATRSYTGGATHPCVAAAEAGSPCVPSVIERTVAASLETAGGKYQALRRAPFADYRAQAVAPATAIATAATDGYRQSASQQTIASLLPLNFTYPLDWMSPADVHQFAREALEAAFLSVDCGTAPAAARAAISRSEDADADTGSEAAPSFHPGLLPHSTTTTASRTDASPASAVESLHEALLAIVTRHSLDASLAGGGGGVLRPPMCPACWVKEALGTLRDSAVRACDDTAALAALPPPTLASLASCGAGSAKPKLGSARASANARFRGPLTDAFAFDPLGCAPLIPSVLDGLGVDWDCDTATAMDDYNNDDERCRAAREERVRLEAHARELRLELATLDMEDQEASDALAALQQRRNTLYTDVLAPYAEESAQLAVVTAAMADSLAAVRAVPIESWAFPIQADPSSAMGAFGTITGLRLGLVGSSSVAARADVTGPAAEAALQTRLLRDSMTRQQFHTRAALSGGLTAVAASTDGADPSSPAHPSHQQQRRAAVVREERVPPAEVNAACAFLAQLLVGLAAANGHTFEAARINLTGSSDHRTTVDILETSRAATTATAATAATVSVKSTADFFLTNRFFAWRTFGAACDAVAACVAELCEVLVSKLQRQQVGATTNGVTPAPRPPCTITRGKGADNYSVAHGSVSDAVWTVAMRKLLANVHWCVQASAVRPAPREGQAN